MDEKQKTVQVMPYIPSSSEKKRAVLMYGLFGIIIMIGKKELSLFEKFHLKQAIWWWVVFVFFFILSSIIFFIPVIKLLGIIPLLFMIIVWALFIKQAWDWKVKVEKWKNPLQIFLGVGWWLLDLFEIWPKEDVKLNKQDIEWPLVSDPDMFVATPSSSSDGVSDVVVNKTGDINSKS